jgi:acyl-CoA synthetase
MTERESLYQAKGLWTDERIGWVLPQAAERWPDREFISFRSQRFTYREFGHWVDAVAVDLVGRGLAPRDHILVRLPNTLEALVLQLAAFRIGAVACPVITSCSQTEMRHIIGDLRPSAIAVASAHGDRQPTREVDGILDELGHSPRVKFAVGGLVNGWSAIVRPTSTERRAEIADLPGPLPADECCFVLHTSGTTGLPKGVMLSSRALLCEARQWRLTSGLTFQDVLLCCGPMSHLAGVHGGFLLPATLGARAVVMPNWDPDEARRLIEEENVTFSLGPPVFLIDLVQRYEAEPPKRLTLARFQCGGAAVSPTLVERAHRLGILTFKAYGMSETAGSCSLGCPTDPLDVRANTEGRLNEGVEMEAVDESRRALPPGQLGEIRIRTPQSMIGYRDPRRTAELVDAEGWIYTGDLGAVTEDGLVRITGRLKDIINRGGEKFSAIEIENAVATHPDVASAAVVGLPDDRLGEMVVVALTLRPGAIWSGHEVMLDHLETIGLAKKKRPVRWQVLDELPATPSGKVKKNLLIAMLQTPAAECL